MSKQSDKNEPVEDETILDEETKERKKSKKSKKSKDEKKEKIDQEEVNKASKKKETEEEEEEESTGSSSKKKSKKDKDHSSSKEDKKTDVAKNEEIKNKDQKEEDSKEPEIHTANNWEGVDLGDQNRKMKFLKLMGAFKHQDDKSAPPIKQRKTTFQNDKLNQDLEKQFNEGISHRHQRHGGLGFGASTTTTIESKAKEAPKSNTHITFDE